MATNSILLNHRLDSWLDFISNFFHHNLQTFFFIFLVIHNISSFCNNENVTIQLHSVFFISKTSNSQPSRVAYKQYYNNVFYLTGAPKSHISQLGSRKNSRSLTKNPLSFVFHEFHFRKL